MVVHTCNAITLRQEDQESMVILATYSLRLAWATWDEWSLSVPIVLCLPCLDIRNDQCQLKFPEALTQSMAHIRQAFFQSCVSCKSPFLNINPGSVSTLLLHLLFPLHSQRGLYTLACIKAFTLFLKDFLTWSCDSSSMNAWCFQIKVRPF